MPIDLNFDQPFIEAIEYFQRKGFAISPDSWRDVWKDAHARAFTVARVTALDVLDDIREELDKALAEGTGIKEFREAIIPKLEAKGWWAAHPKDAVIDIDGEERKRLTAWRLRTIFDTNINTAYAVGRYKQMMEVVDVRPYWQYLGVKDELTRDTHEVNFYKVYPANHAFWAIWYPPNGFRCRCFVRSLSDRDIKRRGLDIQNDMPKDKDGDDVKPEEGWDYNPGATPLGDWKPERKYADADGNKILDSVKKATQNPKKIKYIEIKSQKDGQKYIFDAQDRLNMTDAEKSAVDDYKGSGYFKINKHLRGVKDGDDDTKRLIADMDSAMRKMTTDDNIIVYRQAGKPVFENYAKDIDARITGGELQEVLDER